jgi:crossover junction endodeoxyribonuclease RuvC
MIILGIDPGTQNLGYGIIEKNGSRLKVLEAGVIKFPDRELQNAIRTFPVEFEKILQRWKIDEVAVETVFFSKNPKSIIKLAQFRGALMFFLLQNFSNISEYSPLEIKKSVTGNGKATKEQVNFMVKTILNIKQEIKPLDISDALAIAITQSQKV